MSCRRPSWEGQIYLRRQHRRMHEDGCGHEHDHDEAGLSTKRLVVSFFVAVLVSGLVAFALTGGTA
jgi:ABC-type nickel/cobalt efflux system permease component RcnA